MKPNRFSKAENTPEQRLKWPLRLTHGGMMAEAVLRAFWPALSLFFLGLAALLSGLVAWLPLRLGQGVLLVIGLGFIVALLVGVRRLAWPGKPAARARLDASLPGQPIAALADQQAIGTDDDASRAVWTAFQARMRARLAGAKAQAPDLRLASRDPYALRYSALLAFLVALGFGGAYRTADLANLMPGAGASPAIATASWEGWIQPPAYTGQPSLYLNDQRPGALEIPVGSSLTIRFYGRLGDLGLSETLSGTPIDSSEARASYNFDVMRSGELTISGPNGASWQVTALADQPPVVTPFGDMTRTLAGDLEQGFTAQDDYGVASGQAILVLDLAAVERSYGLIPDPEPRAALTLDLPMPFRGDRRDIEEVMAGNFAEHPWAGLPVSLTLTVTDEVGQSGRSSPITLTLPGRRFLQPLPMALIEQRRDLLWNRENGPRVARIVRAVSNRPDGFLNREVTYLMLRVLVRRLEAGNRFGLSDEVRDEIAQGLWDIAVLLEDGSLADARERLRRAQERLSEAIEQGATQEELAELMDELRDAMREYTQQLGQDQDGSESADQQQAQNGDGQEITQEDLEGVMDQIEELLKQGRQAEAQAMLDALQEMMENLQAGSGQNGQPGDNPGDQAMQDLTDSLNQQQGLSDEAFRDYQEQRNPSAQAGESEGNVGREGGQGKGQSHTGEGGDGGGEGAEGNLAERQQSLADELGRQRRNLPGAGSEPGDAAREALDNAGRAMEDAARGLEQGDLPGALDRQAEAMEALREGMRQLDNALAEAERNRQGQQGQTDGRQGSPRQSDPLGRGPNSRGGVANESPLNSGPDVYRRAEELLQELRRRSGEDARPQPERDYLRRLLDRF